MSPSPTEDGRLGFRATPIDECCGLHEVLRADGHSGRYEVLERVAVGGMSDVVAAWDRRLGRRVALKRCRCAIPKGDLGCLHRYPDPVVGYFAAEMTILSQLHHSSIIPLYDIGLDEEGRLFMAMPLVSERTYLDVIAEVHSGRADWTIRRVLGPLIRVCDALRYAHAKGVVHADIKPANIAIGATGEIYLLDWGLARVLADTVDKRPGRTPSSICLSFVHDRQEAGASAAAHEGAIAGTPQYMPPEYAAEGIVSPSFDVYAFGATLYHLLGGSPPFGELSGNADVLQALLESGPPPVELRRGRVDAPLAAICSRCMERDPADRYASMDAVRGAIDSYMEKRCERWGGRRKRWRWRGARGQGLLPRSWIG